MPDKTIEEGWARRVAGVIVSHGQVANELLSAAETIIGNFKHLTAVSIGWHDDVEAAKNEIRRAVERASEGGGVLLMTDMFGGTPTNIASMCLQQGAVEVVTGVNLPMVIKLAGLEPGVPLEEAARLVRDQGGRASTSRASCSRAAGARAESP